MRTMTRRVLSLLLTLCLLISAFPYVQAGQTESATEEAPQQVITENQTSLVYSENDFYFQLESDTLYEAGGRQKLSLLRGGDVSAAQNVTLLVYDNSTNYGKDYVLRYEGETLAKREGAISIYDAFRDGGQLTDSVEFDMSYTIGLEALEGETVEADAAGAFRQLDELNAKALELPITFPAGESVVELTIELLDDSEEEYEETLMLAVLDAAGKLSETAQQMVRISDNEPAPQVSVGFGCAYEIETDPSSGLAELSFRRTGNLATFTTALLLRDGEVLGYVDFSPYQELQYVWAMPGTYTLASDGDYTVTGETVTVKYVQGYEPLAEGADPILDAIPSTYASLGASQTTKAWSIPDWFPTWAKNTGTTETDTYIAYNGTSGSNVFKKGGTGGTGNTTMNKDGGRMHDLNTSGTGSRVSKNWSNVSTSKTDYDMTGIESIETTVKVEGLDYDNQIILTLYTFGSSNSRTQVNQTVKNNSGDNTVNVSVSLNDNYQGKVQIGVENYDSTGTDDGCHMLIPDGFKANKRSYRFVVTSPGYIYYRGIGDVKVNIQNSSSSMLLKMGEDVHVPIAYTIEGGHPVKLVGYKIRNMSTQATSGVFALAEGQNSFIFDQDFLKAYEATYCADTLYNGVSYNTFEIIPVFEKLKTTVVLENSSMGTLSILNYSGEQLYVGEQIVLSGSAYADVNFVGVYYRKYRNLSGDIYESGEVHAQTTGGNVTLTLGEFNRIVLQPVFKSNSNQLTLAYEESNPANRHGKHAFDNGKTSMIVVKKTEYAKGEFFPLVATPDEGYVTRWTSNGRTYYGNTFYYQLDGYADNNTVMVAFIPETDLQMETITFSGTVNYYDCVLRDLTSTTKPLSEANYIITAGQEYSGKSGSDGSFSIPDFKAVKGGTYSMMVIHGEYFRYLQFTPIPAEGSSQNMELVFPQFANNSFYPDQVRIALGTATSNDNVIQVRDTESGSITVRVVSQGEDCTVLGVKLYFVSTRAADYGATLATYTAFQNEMLTGENDSSIYTYWTLELENPAELPAQSRMYIDVSAEKSVVTTDSQGNLTSQLQEFTSGKVNSGYEFIQAINDTSIAVQQSIPDLPGAQNGYKTNLETLEIPFIGSADFSFTSTSGGFFINRSINGTTYLVCGYTATAVYGHGPLSSKIDGAVKTQEYLNSQASEGRTTTGTAEMENILLGQGGANQGGGNGGNQQPAKKPPSPWTISPAYLIKIALTPGVDENGEDKTFITGYELAFGLDVFFRKSIPFSVYGVPFYVAFSVMVEALVQAQMQLQPGTAAPGQDISLMLYQMCHDPDQMDSAVRSEQFFFSVPLLSMGLRAGIGYDCFLGVYIDGTISAPMMFQLDPNFDVAGQIGFTLAIGADLVLFNAKYNLLSPTAKYGNENLQDDLKTVQAHMNITPPVFELNSVDNSAPATKTRVLAQGEETPELEEVINELSFSLMERPEQGTNLLRAGKIDSDVLAEGVFKNTQIHLYKLENGNILAMFLIDNGEEGMNYLSAAYAISADNGETWSEVQLISNNIGQAVSSVQFNINIYELQDRLLVTWSEADFEKALSGVDLNNLTAGQIATAMNAMNLRGRFMDATTGEVMGDAFTIAENSTVACAALNAVQNGDMVYVYYQRNVFDTDEDATVGDLLATQRTIALAAANVNAPETWTSTPVRAENENGQQYRIADITPFVHDGVMGEIIVLDRDGLLVTYNEETGQWDNSNEDRQLFLRTYDFGEDGKPVPTALLPLTAADACAQAPEVVSTEDYLHLFWNQDGEVVYLTDFVATYEDHPDVQSSAIVLLNEDGTVTLPEQESTAGHYITGSESFEIGTTFTASMADDGNVFLAWIAADDEKQDLNPVDEVYGVILNTVTNGEAMIRSGDEGGNENTYQLWAVGAPIALTDEDSLIGAIDSLCMESGKESKFLLAFTKLNATKRSEVTSADLLVVQSVDAPDVVLNEIEAPAYPQPGSDMSVLVTFSNKGLEPLQGASLTVSGVGETVTQNYDAALLPGESVTVEILVAVPEDFSADATLNITVAGLGEQADYSDAGTAEIYYGAYFILREMSRLVSVPNTTDCLTYTRVYNIGNCAGSPKLTFENTIFATDEFYKTYTFQSEAVVAPGEYLDLEYTLADTLINTQRTAQLVVACGENADQRMDSFMPAQDILVEEPTTPADEIFTDLEGHWAVDYITEIYDEGLMIGTAETTFSPDQATTRGMLATILYRLEGEPEFDGKCPFADVPAGVYYEKPIAWAASQGILQGYGDGTFGPENIVTREQMVTIFYRYAKSKGYDLSATGDLSGFADQANISPYALDAVAWAVGCGLINGTEPTLLEPLGSTTRAQIAAIIVRFRNYFPKE
ncbi:MAG: S-layer homology domain-containing protein [Oscillospiraceae bacterium]|nr:S-layer homology domain-containing protein [Oscillospiraceae bacterium]